MNVKDIFFSLVVTIEMNIVTEYEPEISVVGVHPFTINYAHTLIGGELSFIMLLYISLFFLSFCVCALDLFIIIIKYWLLCITVAITGLFYSL